MSVVLMIRFIRLQIYASSGWIHCVDISFIGRSQRDSISSGGELRRCQRNEQSEWYVIKWFSISNSSNGCSNNSNVYCIKWCTVYLQCSRYDCIYISDQNGYTALMLASQRGRKNTVTLLVENGADGNAQNKVAGIKSNDSIAIRVVSLIMQMCMVFN